MHLLVTQWLITDSNTLRLLFQGIFVREVGSIFLISAALDNSPLTPPHSSDRLLTSSSCELPETWRRVFAAILGHTKNQHQVKGWDLDPWQPMRGLQSSIWTNQRPGLAASCSRVVGVRECGGWHSALESAISQPFFGQIWVENIPLSNMRTCFCHHHRGTKSLKCSNFNYGHNMSSVTRRNNNLQRSGENSRPNYRSLNIFLTGKYEAGETLSELHPPELTGPGTF